MIFLQRISQFCTYLRQVYEHSKCGHYDKSDSRQKKRKQTTYSQNPKVTSQLHLFSYHWKSNCHGYIHTACIFSFCITIYTHFLLLSIYRPNEFCILIVDCIAEICTDGKKFNHFISTTLAINAAKRRCHVIKVGRENFPGPFVRRRSNVINEAFIVSTLFSPSSDGFMTRLIGRHLQAINMSIADPLMFEGDVLQQPTTPVMNETNMKKKAVIKSAIIARPMSAKQKWY